MKFTILCIEDNHFNMRLSKKMLHMIGYNVLEAPTGLIGLDIASKKRPDLILLDINLPDVDGIAVFKRLRHMAITRNIPTVAVTANTMDGDRERYLNIGFDGYIAKPIIRIELQNTLNKLLHLKDTVES